MSLHRNPELIRHVWLELTPQRLLATPIILALILLVAWQLSDKLGNRFGDLPTVCLALFAMMTVLWGTKLAGDCLSQELTQGTWDSQRLSGMGAWQMTLGKLLGGPVFAWYGGVLCLAAYAFTAASDGTSIRIVLIAVSVAIALHALALLSTLTSWRKLPRTTVGARQRATAFLLPILFVPQLSVLLRHGSLSGGILWYGWTISTLDFVLLCAALAMFWCVLGLYRMMREELALRDPPVAWILFLLFLFVFAGGWFYGRGDRLAPFPDMAPVTAHLALCSLLSLAANYVLLFSERKDWLRLRRLVALWQDGQRRRAWALTPKWMAMMMLTAVSALAFCFSSLITEPAFEGIAGVCTATAAYAFLVRDTAIVLALNFTRDQRRADAAAGLYIVLLYLLLPGVLAALHLHFLVAAVWPPLTYQQPYWLILIIAESLLALDYARRRWWKLPG